MFVDRLDVPQAAECSFRVRAASIFRADAPAVGLRSRCGPEMSGTRIEDSRRGSARRRWSLIVAVAVLLTGLALSVLSATVWRAADQRDQRQRFRLTASNVTATLEALLRRDTDFVASLRTIMTMQPGLSATGFDDWYDNLQGAGRQVGGIGSAFVASVPAAQLTAFLARRDADPAFRALMGRWLAPVVRANQSRYCLLAGGNAIMPLSSLAASLVQEDWCLRSSPLGSDQASLLQLATDTGDLIAVPVDVAWLHTMFLETAFYLPGMPRKTVTERRVAVKGWLVGSFDIPTIIEAAIGHNRALTVTLYHANPGQSSQLVGSAGSARGALQLTAHTTIDLDGTWNVVIRGDPVTTGPSIGAQSALVLGAGAFSSVLLAALIFTLARGRDRALEMVAEKTRELRHQALHDALTGLPNRVLAIDRAEQMLARARRTKAPIAALYVDIDAFKQINDTFGHAAGDRFLRSAAARLCSVLRTGDTAARLSGDEFLVLLECSPPDGGPQALAQRLLDVLREPYELDAAAGTQGLRMTVSIGIAYGQRPSAEQLLADADVALYAAKAAGKDRFVMFESGRDSVSAIRPQATEAIMTRVA